MPAVLCKIFLKIDIFKELNISDMEILPKDQQGRIVNVIAKFKKIELTESQSLLLLKLAFYENDNAHWDIL